MEEYLWLLRTILSHMECKYELCILQRVGLSSLIPLTAIVGSDGEGRGRLRYVKETLWELERLDKFKTDIVHRIENIFFVGNPKRRGQPNVEDFGWDKDVISFYRTVALRVSNCIKGEMEK